MTTRKIKKWQLAEKMPDDFMRTIGVDSLVLAQLFYNRGIRDTANLERYLHPRYEDISDPYLMKDMDKMIARLIRAIEKHESVLIFGDYDVDGCCATAIMLRVLRYFGLAVDYYIPHRIHEGYGLNHQAIDEIADRGVTLMITVDNGSGSYDEVSYAATKGIDVVITDHHEVTKELPDCVAVINPRQPGDIYPCKDLCGAAVSYQCMRALVMAMTKRGRASISEDMMKWYLDLVALATVADVMRLDTENRIFVYYGVMVLQKTKNTGIRAIAKMAGIPLSQATTQTIGFQIAPRINAAGRMAHAGYALTLLTTDNQAEAEMLALQLERLNRERQASVTDHLARVSQSIVDPIPKIFVLRDDMWNSGILGLIAGRLSEQYARPVFCAALEGAYIKGSARSSVDFHIVEAMNAASKHLIKYGGHKLAGGFSVAPENFVHFALALQEYADTYLSTDEVRQVIAIDVQIGENEITHELMTRVSVCEPFGNGNQEPCFVAYGLCIAEAKAVGGDKQHLKLVFQKADGTKIGGIAFRMGDLAGELIYGTTVDVVFVLQENEWGGRKRVELGVKDIRLSQLEHTIEE